MQRRSRSNSAWGLVDDRVATVAYGDLNSFGRLRANLASEQSKTGLRGLFSRLSQASGPALSWSSKPLRESLTVLDFA